ncbi:MAG: glycosyltransferase family 2 protein [Polyangia bacterium]
MTTAPQKPLPRIAIITVIYRCASYLPGFMQSLAEVDYPRDRLELHLVDNGPGDGSLEVARTAAASLATRLPQVVIHEPGRNLGFAAGNNLALRAAIAAGFDYCYLLNPDATFEAAALAEAVRVAGQSERVGSVQSLLVLGDRPEVVNTSGNHIHFLGFGYVGGYQTLRQDVALAPRDITFSSGACMLVPSAILQEVGLFDETLWLYHEDLDLGWRMRIAGYRNLLAPASVCRHFYEFSRSAGKWYWMERNRWIVLLKNYRLATILLLLPALLAADAGLLLMAARGGWLGSKLRALAWFMRPAAWAHVRRGRRAVAQLRKVPDRDLLQSFTATIDFPEFRGALVTGVVEPLWKLMLAILRMLVRW